MLPAHLQRENCGYPFGLIVDDGGTRLGFWPEVLRFANLALHIFPVRLRVKRKTKASRKVGAGRFSEDAAPTLQRR
jgi:hypothetical protein